MLTFSSLFYFTFINPNLCWPSHLYSISPCFLIPSSFTFSSLFYFSFIDPLLSWPSHLYSTSPLYLDICIHLILILLHLLILILIQLPFLPSSLILIQPFSFSSSFILYYIILCSHPHLTMLIYILLKQTFSFSWSHPHPQEVEKQTRIDKMRSMCRQELTAGRLIWPMERLFRSGSTTDWLSIMTTEEQEIVNQKIRENDFERIFLPWWVSLLKCTRLLRTIEVQLYPAIMDLRVMEIPLCRRNAFNSL